MGINHSGFRGSSRVFWSMPTRPCWQVSHVSYQQRNGVQFIVLQNGFMFVLLLRRSQCVGWSFHHFLWNYLNNYHTDCEENLYSYPWTIEGIFSHDFGDPRHEADICSLEFGGLKNCWIDNIHVSLRMNNCDFKYFFCAIISKIVCKTLSIGLVKFLTHQSDDSLYWPISNTIAKIAKKKKKASFTYVSFYILLIVHQLYAYIQLRMAELIQVSRCRSDILHYPNKPKHACCIVGTVEMRTKGGLEGSSRSLWTEKRSLAVCLSSCLPDCFGLNLWFQLELCWNTTT